MSESSISGPNPSGLCMCGCGKPAPIAAANDKRYGIVKGQPQRYIKGHSQYKSLDHYKVDETTGCWVWQRAVNSSGYGHLYVDGVHKYAHVHYYEIANGEVGDNGREYTASQVHHKCGNKLCVNPEHLELSSVDAHRREHGIVKINEDVVREIRRMDAEGISRREIERQFGLSQSHVCGIIKRRFWKDVA